MARRSASSTPAYSALPLVGCQKQVACPQQPRVAGAAAGQWMRPVLQKLIANLAANARAAAPLVGTGGGSRVYACAKPVPIIRHVRLAGARHSFMSRLSVRFCGLALNSPVILLSG